MIRYAVVLFLALLGQIGAAQAASTPPVVAEMTIAKQGTKDSYSFEWRDTGLWGAGSMKLKWSNYDPAIHFGGYNIQNSRIKVLLTPQLPAGCQFELWETEIKENGADSHFGFRVRGASCPNAFQDLARGDFTLQIFHVPQLGDSRTTIVPQLELHITGQ